MTTAPVRDIRVRSIAAGPLGADEVRALAFVVAGGVGTVIGCWLAGLVA